MTELGTAHEELTTADLPSYAISPADGPELVAATELKAMDRAVAVAAPMPLFSESEMGDFRSQWGHIQSGFVDEPRRTVEDADTLVAAVMQRLAEGFATSGRAWKSSGMVAITCPLRTCGLLCSDIVPSFRDC
jgi:hypothetical protein